MASKNILTKEDKLNDDIWHRKVQYLSNEHELLDHLTKSITPLKVGNMTQQQFKQESYDA